MSQPMTYILLSIVSSTLIFIIFKLLNRFAKPILPVITLNYLAAAVLGILISMEQSEIKEVKPDTWLIFAILIGISFILMFLVIAESTHSAGMAVSTVAAKLSVVIPIVFSIVIDPEDIFSSLKIAGLFLALAGVFLTIIKKDNKYKVNQRSFIFPLVLFFGMGVVDSLVKYSQMHFVPDSRLALFSASLFFVAFITGVLFILFRKRESLAQLVKKSTIFWGVLLGISNFGSIYFIIKALNFKNIAGKGIGGSVVFAINNTGVVIFSVIIGLLIFDEKLSRINIAGVILAILSIIAFSYA